MRLLRDPSNLTLNTSREPGAATASLSNMYQGLTTFTGNNFFLTFNLNLFTDHVHSPCPVSLCPCKKSLFSKLFGQGYPGVFKCDLSLKFVLVGFFPGKKAVDLQPVQLYLVLVLEGIRWTSCHLRMLGKK